MELVGLEPTTSWVRFAHTSLARSRFGLVGRRAVRSVLSSSLRLVAALVAGMLPISATPSADRRGPLARAADPAFADSVEAARRSRDHRLVRLRAHTALQGLTALLLLAVGLAAVGRAPAADDALASGSALLVQASDYGFVDDAPTQFATSAARWRSLGSVECSCPSPYARERSVRWRPWYTRAPRPESSNEPK